MSELSDTEDDFDLNPFVCLRDVLKSRSPGIGTLATAIEQNGIYTWDRFGRFGHADERAKNRALDALAEHYKYSYFFLIRHLGDTPDYGEKEHDVAMAIMQRFGWPSDQCPDFDAIRKGLGSREPPKPKAAETRARDTLLTIIATLADQAQIDLGERGAAGRIADWTQLIGAPVSDDTVRNILKLIPEAIERRGK